MSARAGHGEAVSPGAEATRHAADLRAAAERLHDLVADAGATHVPMRDAMDLVGHALGELTAMAERMSRELAVSHTAVAPYRASSELVRRTHELASSLSAARRNAELVCRNLPRPREVREPVAVGGAPQDPRRG